MRSTLFPQLPQRAFALMLLLPAACVTASAQDDDVLKRFVGEFIEITPGEAPFPGEFQIGSEEGEPSERPVRTVQLRRPFKIGRYEVWQDLYERVTGTNPSRWKGPRNSAERMSWRESNEFCRKATLLLREQKLIADDEVVRLPTEAEWEYCCRAGTETRFSFGSAAQKSRYFIKISATWRRYGCKAVSR